MTTLYRTMKMGTDGNPVCGRSSRKLGVRVPGGNNDTIDITPDEDNNVHPNSGGMSVFPDDPLSLGVYPGFIPLSKGGFSKNPVFEIEVVNLVTDLTFRRDPQKSDSHGFVEPSNTVKLDKYEKNLCDTASDWSVYLR